MGTTFHFEHWTVDIITTAGKLTYMFKGKTKDAVIKQIEKMVVDTDKAFNDPNIPWWKKSAPIKKVCWETLKLDHTGYNRLY